MQYIFKSIAFAAISAALLAPQASALRIPRAQPTAHVDRRQVSGGAGGSITVGGATGTIGGSFDGSLPTQSVDSLTSSLSSALGALPTGTSGLDLFESFVEEVTAEIYDAFTGASDSIPGFPTTNDVGNTIDNNIGPLAALAAIFNNSLSSLLSSYDLNSLPTGTLVPLPDVPAIPAVPSAPAVPDLPDLPDVDGSADSSATASTDNTSSSSNSGLGVTARRALSLARKAAAKHFIKASNLKAAKSRYYDSLPFSLPAVLAIFNDAFNQVAGYGDLTSSIPKAVNGNSGVSA